jgi:hypothetical protein
LLQDKIKKIAAPAGEAYSAFEWMNFNQATEKTCSIYKAPGHENGQEPS